MIAANYTGNVTIRTKKSCVGVLARVDQFEVVRKLGSGGFGSVYLAKDTVSGVDVALKVVGRDAAAISELKENFQLVQELSHENIAPAYPLHPVKDVKVCDGTGEFDVREGDVLSVLKYARGVTLDRWRMMYHDGRVPCKDALGILAQIANALDHAHCKGVIHRDIKPSNVMIEMRPEQISVVRLLDFGLATAVGGQKARGEICGTPQYMSPEQWLGETQDAQTDQYGLAVLACELLTGHVPYETALQSGDSEIMRIAVTSRDVEIPTGLSMRQRTVLTRAMAKSPAARYKTCSEFVECLRLACHWPMRNYVIGVAVALAIVLCAVLLLSRIGDQTEPVATKVEMPKTPMPPTTLTVPDERPAVIRDMPPQTVTPASLEPKQNEQISEHPATVDAPDSKQEARIFAVVPNHQIVTQSPVKPLPTRVEPLPTRVELPPKKVWYGFAGKDKTQFKLIEKWLASDDLSDEKMKFFFPPEEYKVKKARVDELRKVFRCLQKAVSDHDELLARENLKRCVELYKNY